MQSTTNPVHWISADLSIFEGDRANRYEIRLLAAIANPVSRIRKV